MKHIYKIGGLLALSGTFFSGSVLAQNAEEIISNERARVIARGISASIVGAITDQSDELGAGSSADGGSLLPDAIWTNSSWTEISDDGIAGNLDADVYQFTLGTDKRFGDFFIGASTTYAYTETEIGGTILGSQGHTHSINVTPYAAFIINKNFFVTAMTGYTFSRSEPDVAGFNFDSDTDEYTSELTLNGVHAVEKLFFKGKAGFRYRHSDNYFDTNQSSLAIRDNDADDWTYLVDAEVGYKIAKGLRGYAGALYEYTETEDGEDDGVLYMSTGVDYSVSDKFTVGLKYSTDANNEDIDIHTVGLNMRLAL